MKSLRFLIGAIGTLSLVSGGLLAQDKVLQGGLVRASKVTGMDVRSAANENLGDIQDVVLDRDSGTIAYAVVSFGGFLNMGDKLFAVPWEALKPTADRGAFVLDVSKERLEKAPGFDKNNWPDMVDPRWSTEIRTFYGTVAVDARNAGPANGRGESVKREDGTTDGQQVVAVENGNGKLEGENRTILVHTGTVKTFRRLDPAQVVIATDRGEVQAELGPMSFIDRERLTFDPNANVTLKGYDQMQNGRHTFVVTEVTKDGRAVRLRRDDLTPVWTDATVVQKTTDAPSAIHDVTGTVTYVESGTCGESAQGRQVNLRTTDGERIIGLAPGTYLDSQHWQLRANDTITVRGYDYGQAGRRIFVATEVRKGNETWKLRRDDGTPLWR
jgi:sporulation protein YlmC with PRC-barrel domain